MSSQRDQSYYEIALTNRQVMSIFVVLLISILAAFLGGVWLGRDADAAAKMAAIPSMTAAAAEGEEPLEELDFFSRRAQPTESTVAGAPDKDDGRRPARAEAKRAPAPAQVADPEPRAEAADREAPVAAAAEPQAATVEPPVVEPPAPTSTSARSAAEVTEVPDFVVIQVFSSNDEDQARRVMNRLRKAGYPAILSPVEVAGKTLHRVRIGPYTDRDEAQVVAESVNRTFELDTWITH